MDTLEPLQIAVEEQGGEDGLGRYSSYLLGFYNSSMVKKIFVLHLNEASTEPNTDDAERILQVLVLNIVL